MVVYVITAIIFIVAIINLVLGERLYKLPNDKAFFNNVNSVNLEKEKYIAANPRHVVALSVLTGALVGLYLGLARVNEVNASIITVAILFILVIYFMELTRTITLKEGKLTFSRFLYKTRTFDATKITGIYIYSYNKKFLKKHAYTTKLVVVEDNGKKFKFSLSSLDNKSVLNMMKDSFGVVNNKMYIANKNI
ncbi:MAG: hypothetical protein IJO08_01560 [Clostridia bacterium]|nr:hypothetical protein [Clostridia bacterium]